MTCKGWGKVVYYPDGEPAMCCELGGFVRSLGWEAKRYDGRKESDKRRLDEIHDLLHTILGFLEGRSRCECSRHYSHYAEEIKNLADRIGAYPWTKLSAVGSNTVPIGRSCYYEPPPYIKELYALVLKAVRPNSAK